MHLRDEGRLGAQGAAKGKHGLTVSLSSKKGTYAATGIVDCHPPAGTYVIEVDVTDHVGRTTTRQLSSVTVR